MFSYKQELFRKSIHLSSLVYALMVIFLSKNIILCILGIVFFFVVLFDLNRILQWNFSLFRKFRFALRAEEIHNNKFSGAVSFLIACIFVVSLFPKEIASISIMILVFCDSAAALIGKLCGKHKINWLNKSWEGFFAFIIVGIIVCVIYKQFVGDFNYSFLRVFSSVILASISELFAKPLNIDDNFIITLSFALSLLYLPL